MSTTGVRVHVTFKPKDREAFMAAAKAVMAATRKEAGCLHYEMFESAIDPSETELAMIEHWESLETLKAHGESEHVKAFQANVKDLLEDSPCIKVYKTCGH